MKSGRPLHAVCMGGQNELQTSRGVLTRPAIFRYPPRRNGGYRWNNEALGTAVRPAEIVLVTKVGFRYEGNRLVNQCSSFDHVVTAAEGCLRRLGTD